MRSTKRLMKTRKASAELAGGLACPASLVIANNGPSSYLIPVSAASGNCAQFNNNNKFHLLNWELQFEFSLVKKVSVWEAILHSEWCSECKIGI